MIALDKKGKKVFLWEFLLPFLYMENFPLDPQLENTICPLNKKIKNVKLTPSEIQRIDINYIKYCKCNLKFGHKEQGCHKEISME